MTPPSTLDRMPTSRPAVRALALAAAGGLVTNLAFPYHSWWPAAFIGVALLGVGLREVRPGTAALAGLTWGLGFFLPLLSWSLHSVGQWPPWVALSVSQAAFVAAFGLLYAVAAARLPAWRVPVAVVLWVGLEQARMIVPFGGFPWGTLAFSQGDGPLLRLASWGGTVLVSGVVVAGGWTLAELAARPGRRTVLGVVAAAAVVAGAGLVPVETGAESGRLTVAAVQGSVPVRGEEALGQARGITANYRALTESLAAEGEEIDIVLWPESAADIDPRTDDEVAADVTAAQAAVGVPLLLGTQRYTTDTRYNDYIGWRDGRAFASYTKQHPVPFGEYIPHRDFFRRLSSAVDLVGVDMAQGEDPGVMDVPIGRLGRDVVVGVGICFEVAYHELLRESVQLGAEFLVIPTNNASFGFTQEATQQLAISRFRAVEHGRATVQVSTVGVSGFFLPDGTIVARSTDELYTEWVGVEDLPLRTSLSVSDRLGDAPRTIVWAAALLALAAALARRGTPSSRRKGNE